MHSTYSRWILFRFIYGKAFDLRARDQFNRFDRIVGVQCKRKTRQILFGPLERYTRTKTFFFSNIDCIFHEFRSFHRKYWYCKAKGVHRRDRSDRAAKSILLILHSTKQEWIIFLSISQMQRTRHPSIRYVRLCLHSVATKCHISIVSGRSWFNLYFQTMSRDKIIIIIRNGGIKEKTISNDKNQTTTDDNNNK